MDIVTYETGKSKKNNDPRSQLTAPGSFSVFSCQWFLVFLTQLYFGLTPIIISVRTYTILYFGLTPKANCLLEFQFLITDQRSCRVQKSSPGKVAVSKVAL